MKRLSNELHRRGVARTINSRSNNYNRRCGTYIETSGPRWLGERLWRFALRNTSHVRPDWLTVRVSEVQQVSRWRYRWQISYDRIDF